MIIGCYNNFKKTLHKYINIYQIQKNRIGFKLVPHEHPDLLTARPRLKLGILP